MQIQVKQSYKGQNISSLYRFPFVYSKRPNIGPADYWSLTLTIARQHLDAYTAYLMLILVLARFMRLKALDNSQTDRGSVARYTPTALECAMFVGVAPLLYDLLTSSFASWLYCLLKGQATSACTRKSSEVSGCKHDVFS